MESREKRWLCSGRSRVQDAGKKKEGGGNFSFSFFYFISFRFVVIESKCLKLFLIDNSRIQRCRNIGNNIGNVSERRGGEGGGYFEISLTLYYHGSNNSDYTSSKLDYSFSS